MVDSYFELTTAIVNSNMQKKKCGNDFPYLIFVNRYI